MDTPQIINVQWYVPLQTIHLGVPPLMETPMISSMTLGGGLAGMPPPWPDATAGMSDALLQKDCLALGTWYCFTTDMNIHVYDNAHTHNYYI